MELAQDYAALLTQMGWIIISGLAEGCTTAAHGNWLQSCGLTMAVMATCLDTVMPAGNRKLPPDLQDAVSPSHSCAARE
nr:DNA-processing protein DprA [Anaerolineae bacterium]